MAIATIDDVAQRMRRTVESFDELERGQIEAWLNDIESKIVDRVGPLDPLISGGRLQSATVVRIEAAAVIRKAENPGGLRSVTRQFDDYQRTEVRDQALSDGQLRLTDEEWADLLTAVAEGALSGAYSVPLAPPWA